MAARSRELLALGTALRQLREDRGFTQETIGYRTGLHRNHVGGIERGERNPTYTTLLKLAKALQVTPADLMLKADALVPRD